ncbi:ABC-2 transporter permease [Sporolactobacillus shoreicorticis]|uniref:ABC-2 transporter permease n=1 Tax=Sporolactobacillus shoreicorticis TaxID=1923877 RepID=A0ABW5S084_9BACL|nr:ABC-2 transporter permease [Sporolactobacillus shoreicorticis]MCO7126800.1 ABC-2 transporter permease [Sporolactobacillus shoreicorticis]
MMRSLMIKDVVIQGNRTYLVMLAILIIISAQSYFVDAVFKLSIFSVLVACVFAVNTNFGKQISDEQNALLISLPLKRRTLVTAKYLMISVWFTAVFVAFFGFRILFICFSGGAVIGDVFLYLSAFLIGMSTMYIFLSLYYFSYYRWGIKIAQVAAQVIWPACIALLPWINLNDHQLSGLLVLISVFAAVVVLLLSYYRSVRLFEERDL